MKPDARKFHPLDIDNTALLNVLKKAGRFTYIPNPGNLGDMLIGAATLQFFAHNGLRSVDDLVFSVVCHEVELLAVGHEIGDLGRGDRFHPGAHVYQEPFLVNRWRLRRGSVLRRRAAPPR